MKKGRIWVVFLGEDGGIVPVNCYGGRNCESMARGALMLAQRQHPTKRVFLASDNDLRVMERERLCRE